MFFIYILIVIICILIGVAFTTLLERKILGYIQLRKGPNKVGLMGLLQPFSDGLKLFFKEQVNLGYSNFFIYYISPIFILILSFILWSLFPYLRSVFKFDYGAIFFLCCTGIGVYGVLICGWSSNSNYAILGAIRSVAQTISYEVRIALIIINFLILIYRFNFIDFLYYQSTVWFIFLSLPLFFSWFSSILAETNRSPFDFAEGESELVSGFNIEYRRGGFAYIFLSEYINIIFISILTSIIFMGCDIYSIIFFYKIVFLVFIFIWVRGTLPRFRYDKLIYLTWKVFLPLSLNYIVFFCGILMLIIIF